MSSRAPVFSRARRLSLKAPGYFARTDALSD